MNDFYTDLPPEQASQVSRLARAAYELRDSRKSILDYHQAADEAELRARIEAGTLDEHPAWEHYLAVRVLAETREAARGLIAETLSGAARA